MIADLMAVNGRPVFAEVEPRKRLVRHLCGDLGPRGPHIGCERRPGARRRGPLLDCRRPACENRGRLCRRA
jgi:hypothetical protein